MSGGRKTLAWLPSPGSHSGLSLPVAAAAKTLGSLLLKKRKKLLHRLESHPGFIHDKIEQIVPVDAAANTLGSLLLEKRKELLHRLESLPGFNIHDKIDQIHVPVDAAANTLGSLLLDKRKELLHLLESLSGFIHDKIDQILPPETRSADLHRYLAFALTVALALFCFYYFCKFCCCCSRGLAGIGGKMMKAPGGMGMMILRAPFEADPRGYFLNLRASP